MFSKGQVIFAIIFLLVFVAAMIWAYRKDIPTIRQHYQGVMYILIGIIVFILIYRYLVKFVH